MARTIAEIQQEIIDSIQADSNLSEASSTSSTALWRLMAYVVASAIALLENLYDTFKSEVNADLSALKPHSLRWYQGKALLFQYGSDLPEDSDVYDNSLLDDATVEGQKIVAQAAATENNGEVRVKVAKEVSDELEPLAAAEIAAFTAYIQNVKDAGVSLEIINSTADRLVLEIDVYYDPLILDQNGNRLDGAANDVVKTAIKNYLRNLPFDGVFVKSHLTDALQLTDGVYVPVLRGVQASKSGSAALQTVDVQYNPFSGFLKIEDADLTLSYINKETL